MTFVGFAVVVVLVRYLFHRGVLLWNPACFPLSQRLIQSWAVKKHETACAESCLVTAVLLALLKKKKRFGFVLFARNDFYSSASLPSVSCLWPACVFFFFLYALVKIDEFFLVS